MNIYLDFEATQFSKEIISIGSVNELGDTFFSLVKPCDIKNITKLITKITGLSYKDFENKQIGSIAEVMPRFWDWCNTTSDGDISIFVYGNFDIYLLGAEYARNPNIVCLKEIEDVTHNLCVITNKLVYGLTESHGLLQVYKDLTGLYKEQTHDPVDDAQMLMEIHKHIKDTSLDTLKKLEEVYYINRYKKKHRKNRIFNVHLRNYFNSLCPSEIENIQYESIGSIIGYAHLENRVRNDYLELTGKHLEGSIYGL